MSVTVFESRWEDTLKVYDYAGPLDSVTWLICKGRSMVLLSAAIFAKFDNKLFVLTEDSSLQEETSSIASVLVSVVGKVCTDGDNYCAANSLACEANGLDAF